MHKIEKIRANFCVVNCNVGVRNEQGGKWLLLRDDLATLSYNAQCMLDTCRWLYCRCGGHAFRLEKNDGLRVDVARGNKCFAPYSNAVGNTFRVSARLFSVNSRRP